MMQDVTCNTLVHLIFVRSVNIPNLSLLPCLEVAYDACMMYDAWCNTLVDLIFVRTVSVPNLNLLPRFEVAYFFFWHTKLTKLTDKAIYWGSMLPKNLVTWNIFLPFKSHIFTKTIFKGFDPIKINLGLYKFFWFGKNQMKIHRKSV